MTALADLAWMNEGLCKGADPSLWFPEAHADPIGDAKAKAICMECPILDRCRSYALRNNEVWGTWGGLTATELKRERRRLRRRELEQQLRAVAS